MSSMSVEVLRPAEGTLHLALPGQSLAVHAAAPSGLSATRDGFAMLVEVLHDDAPSSTHDVAHSAIAVEVRPPSLGAALVASVAAHILVDAQSRAAQSFVLALGGTAPLDLATHDGLDSLAHAIAETSETEYAYDGDGNLTRTTVWTSSARTTKVREKQNTFVAGVLTQSVTTQHNSAGAIVSTLTKTFTYDGDGDLVTSTTTRS